MASSATFTSIVVILTYLTVSVSARPSWPFHDFFDDHYDNEDSHSATYGYCPSPLLKLKKSWNCDHDELPTFVISQHSGCPRYKFACLDHWLLRHCNQKKLKSDIQCKDGAIPLLENSLHRFDFCPTFRCVPISCLNSYCKNYHGPKSFPDIHKSYIRNAGSCPMVECSSCPDLEHMIETFPCKEHEAISVHRQGDSGCWVHSCVESNEPQTTTSSQESTTQSAATTEESHTTTKPVTHTTTEAKDDHSESMSEKVDHKNTPIQTSHSKTITSKKIVKHSSSSKKQHSNIRKETSSVRRKVIAHVSSISKELPQITWCSGIDLTKKCGKESFLAVWRDPVHNCNQRQCLDSIPDGDEITTPEAETTSDHLETTTKASIPLSTTKDMNSLTTTTQEIQAATAAPSSTEHQQTTNDNNINVQETTTPEIPSTSTETPSPTEHKQTTTNNNVNVEETTTSEISSSTKTAPIETTTIETTTTTEAASTTAKPVMGPAAP